MVGDSGLFSRDEPLAGLGFAPAVAAEAFRLEPGQVSDLLRTSQGFAFIALEEVKPSALPALADVRETVRQDVVRVQAVDVARARAEQMASAASRNFAAAARAAGVEVKSTDLITRGAPLPEVGVSPAVDDAVFGLEQGQTSSPIVTDSAVVVARVAERESVTPEAIDEGRTALRAELLQQRRNTFFAAYMSKAKQKMRIGINDNALSVVMGR
jgi:peptidyl-prolyl cis-trans isomerase D